MTQMSLDAYLSKLFSYSESKSGASVTTDSAMRQATVYSCVRILSDSIAQLPCKLMRKENGRRAILDDSPLHTAISASPAPWLSAFDFWKFNVQCLLLKGFFLNQIVPNSQGEPVRLIPVQPNHINAIRRENGEMRFDCVDDKNSPYTLKQKEAFFCYYATIDGITPLSPIAYQREAIGLAITAENHGARTFKNSARPSGVLEHPAKLSDEAAKKLRSSWESMYSGDNVGKTAVLEDGMKFNPVTMSNVDAQYLDSRRFQKHEICGIFGVPPHMAGDLQQAKGWSTMEQMMSEFVTLSLNPLNTRIESAGRLCLIPRQRWQTDYMKFFTNGLLRGDSGARMDYYAQGIDKGILNPNECRGFEDLDAREGGDEYMPISKVQPTQKQQKAQANESQAA